MPSISFPFRVAPRTYRPEDVVYPGSPVATNEDGSDPEANEAIAVHLMVQPGERPMRPDFGTDSPSFGPGLDKGALQLQLDEHGWNHIRVKAITDTVPEGGRVESTVTWERSY